MLERKVFSLLVTDVYHKQVWRVVGRASRNFAGGSTVQDLYGQPVGLLAQGDKLYIWDSFARKVFVLGLG